MEPVIRLEHDCAAAWPALTEERLGDWRMRAAGGFTGRANSTLTTGNPGMDIASALRRTIDFAASNGIDPTAHVVVDSPAEEGLTRAGWSVNFAHPGGAESRVMTGPLSPGGLDGAVVHDTPQPGWWELTVGTSAPTPAQRHVLGSQPGIGYGVVVRDGEVVAAVRGFVVGDLLHVARLAVRPSHRRLGLATGLLRTLYTWAEARGARRQALQVSTDNVAAFRLYSELGCVEHHRYRYWIPA